ncbi:MAG: FkbM family methyltransferase [Candidatus Marinimicrobia bacterium]|nr:FkbM family methyltransferase [Candidatus Neomarinimicrobiota bacterium]
MIKYLIYIHSIYEKIARKLGRQFRYISYCNNTVKLYARTHNEWKHTSPREQDYIERLLKQGSNNSVFWDIGSNIGLFSVLFSKKYPEAKILAFEPAPTNYKVILENIKLNNLNNIEVYDIALGESQENLILKGLDEKGWGGSSFLRPDNIGEKEYSVVVTSGSMLVNKQNYSIPTLLKIDVEGFEMSVLHGLEDILVKHHPDIFIEFHPEYLAQIGISLADGINYIEKQGYRLVHLAKVLTGNQYLGIFEHPIE